MGLADLRRRLKFSTQDLHTLSLEERYRGVGETAMQAAPTRQQVHLGGEVIRQKVVPRAGSPVLAVTVSDGTGDVDLIFTGRRSVGGLAHGRGVTVEGVISVEHGRRVMLNPTYQLLPMSGA